MRNESVLTGILHSVQELCGDKEDLIGKYVQERLEKSLQSYKKELEDSVSFLERKNTLKMMRRLNRQL